MRTPQPFWTHFGLKRNPFGNIESKDDVFESRELARTMDLLAEAVEEGGIYSVTGERGIGKTTAKNEIIAYFDENKSRYAYSILECMDLEVVTMGTVLSALVTDLSSEPVKQFAEQRSRQARRIIGEIAARKKVVLIIDESQRLAAKTMEQLKMLTEMKWGIRSRLITVLLFGQPELIARISRDKGLFLRVTQYNMRGLSEDEVLQYIDVRCRIAGRNMDEIFSKDALLYISQNLHSPLHINHICSGTMREAKCAGEKQVSIEMVYKSDGIRNPRQILRDAGLNIHAFAKEAGVRVDDAAKVLDGQGDDVDPEKRELVRSAFQGIIRGAREQAPEQQRNAG
ncbi:MAG: hypothetical protein AVO39_10160 [delta proteobacterium MLS_D]|nr:MAG: hypothetical protein AVO39_10160 [delta proteobacterium MLS_D]